MIQELPYETSEWLLLSKEERLQYMQEEIVKAYYLKREALSALEIAKTNNQQIDWEEAFRKAIEADVFFQKISLYKLQIKYSMSKSSDMLSTMFLTLGGLMVFLTLIKPLFKINQEDSEFYFTMYWTLLFFPKLLMSLVTHSYGEFIIPFIAPGSATKNVLNSTSEFNVQLWGFLPGRDVGNSDTVICKIVNSVNYEDELTAIQDDYSDAPREFLCPISQTLMTDPVYDDQKQARFERTQILDWLGKKSINPVTNLPLYKKELKRDYSLKWKIDQYVAERLQKKRQDLLSKQILDQLVHVST